MPKLPVLFALGLLASAQEAPTPLFCGRITYQATYQNPAGEPVYYAAPLEHRFYVSADSYKWYDHHQQLYELYEGATGRLTRFEQGRPVTPDPVGSAPPAPTVQCLAATATVLGYPCQALRLVQGGVPTLVFYAPALRVDPVAFSRCPTATWGRLLQATGGGLPLRIISVEARRGFIVTEEATAVEPLALTAADFTPDAPAR